MRAFVTLHNAEPGDRNANERSSCLALHTNGDRRYVPPASCIRSDACRNRSTGNSNTASSSLADSGSMAPGESTQAFGMSLERTIQIRRAARGRP